jgi:hypothetical protein
MKRGARRWLAAGVFLLVSSSALASTVERLSLEELVKRADRIVDGRVAEVSSARDGRGRPATRVVLEVRSVLKGGIAKTLEFTLPGGSADGVTHAIAGIPNFTRDEEVVLFLSAESKAGVRVPIGLGQGTFRARADAKTKKTLVQADWVGTEVVDAKTGAKVAAPEGSEEREAFLERVRALAAKK